MGNTTPILVRVRLPHTDFLGTVTMTRFEDLGLNAKILKAIQDMGWTEPTPVQVEAIPVGLDGRDILAQAQTGTGKTATYGTVIMARVPSGLKKPSAIVLCPTRELAMQVEQEMFRLSKYTKHKTVAIYGGSSYKVQFDKLRRGADIIAGTPGRVKDLIEQGVLDLSCVKEAVLDEADRMLDMGFEEEVNFIMSQLPEERHTMLFSATMAKEIMRLGSRFMIDPMELLVSKDEPCSNLVSQYYIPVSRSGKHERLEMLLSAGYPRAIVFCQTKKMVDDLFLELGEKFKAGSLHGDMPQMKREKVIRNFKNDRFKILVATDVAARGIDVNNVELVVNYDVPSDPETYLHRIGRTGRAGNEGIAISFVTKMEDRRVRMYEDETGKKIEKIKIEDAVSMLSGIQRAPPRPERQIVRVQESRSPKQHREMVALQINLGKGDGYGRVDISGLIRDKVKLSDDMVGRVGLGEESSYVEVNGNFSDQIIKTLDGATLKGKKIFVRLAPKKVPYSEKECKRVVRQSGSFNNKPVVDSSE